MSDTEKKLGDLEQWLGRTVGNAYSAAGAIDEPCGSSAEWMEILTHFKVEPVAEEERKKSAKATDQTRGASPEELHLILTNVTKSAGKKLKKIEYPDFSALERRWDRLRSLIDRLLDETMQAYRKKVMPKRGMFAHARAAALKSQGQQGQQAPQAGPKEAFVLRCDGCGAPRLDPDLFECEYCGNSFAKTGG